MTEPSKGRDLTAAADAEHRRFTELAAVAAAEGVVTASRREELTTAQLQARRRLSAAKGLLTKAQKDGSAETIAAARKHYAAADTEYARIADAAIAELLQLGHAGLDTNGELLDQMRRAWAASDRAIDALRPPHTGDPR
jgi:hypothetical protein